MSKVEMKWMGEEVKKAIKERMEGRLETAVRRVVDQTKAELPRDTGRLAESVEYRMDGLKGQWGTDVDYASELEFGTREQAPDGTWRRVTEQSKPMIKDTLTGNR